MGGSFVEKGQEGDFEVNSVTFWEVSNTSHVFFSDLVLEFFQGNLLLAHVGVKLNSISVKPLAMGNGPELLERPVIHLRAVFLDFKLR